ncbi:GtrA family protein [Jeotgalibaca porci]|uniref:GtrA family protein n=1 Tax=Jeotgalibaca porci TaxID=1868793 RepID=A0A6G7WG75_9LACT|nr:GtrA family protein [Jeotgalibaca porci]QIK51198.1 GtrA family protein [Jeotgalibaca porci]
MKRILIIVNKQVDWPDLEVVVAPNGLDYFMSLENRDDYLGIVMVDVNKGYTQADVRKLMDALQADSSKIYLGYQPDQKLSRRMFSLAFWFIHSRRIHDARTGLLAIPTAILESVSESDSPLRFLISAIQKKYVVEEVQVASELQGPRSVSTWSDLWILFQTFIKYVLSSFSSFLVDIVLFQLVIFLFRHLDSDVRILLATVISRVFSSVVNYAINKRVVFQNGGGHRVPALKYFSLVLAEMFTSAFLVAVVYRLTGFPETAIKLLVDLVLFFTGYMIEKIFIFETTKND